MIRSPRPFSLTHSLTTRQAPDACRRCLGRGQTRHQLADHKTLLPELLLRLHKEAVHLDSSSVTSAEADLVLQSRVKVVVHHDLSLTAINLSAHPIPPLQSYRLDPRLLSANNSSVGLDCRATRLRLAIYHWSSQPGPLVVAAAAAASLCVSTSAPRRRATTTTTIEV